MNHEPDDDFSFSFNCGEIDKSPIAADDAFVNGQIRPFFPLSDPPDLLISKDDNIIFVEANDEDDDVAEEEGGGEEIVGPFCSWSSRNKKPVEAESSVVPPVCKKSYSTGFSRIWRLKDQNVPRCNSDRRDDAAFVFLDNDDVAEENPVKSKKKSKKKKIIKKFKLKKSLKPVSSSNETTHFRCKAYEEDDRLRSYLPNRPELLGYFTTVNGGGLTKNVHPY